MLSGDWRSHRRTVQVPCDADAVKFGAAREANTAVPQSRTPSLCAAGEYEEYEGGSRGGTNGKLCQAQCVSYRRGVNGGIQLHRRAVAVSCDVYETRFKASRPTRATGSRSRVRSFCALGEKYSGPSRGGAKGQTCTVDCESKRWTVHRPQRKGKGAGYTASGLYLSGDSTTPLWTVQWCAQAVHLSRDGRYLARMGPWASSASDLAIAFYDRGRLLKEYAVKDLVADTESLPRSVSH